MIGKIHSIETFGAVDGPGIRTVFFMQGCRKIRQARHHLPAQGRTADGQRETHGAAKADTQTGRSSNPHEPIKDSAHPEKHVRIEISAALRALLSSSIPQTYQEPAQRQ